MDFLILVYILWTPVFRTLVSYWLCGDIESRELEPDTVCFPQIGRRAHTTTALASQVAGMGGWCSSGPLELQRRSR